MQVNKEIFNKARFTTDAKLTSKYVVEKNYMLSSTKKILAVEED